MKALYPFQLDESILPVVLDLRELRCRPELALPLVPYLRQASDLPPLTALRAVEFLNRAAHPGLINANLTERALHAIPEILAHGYGWTSALVALANSEPVALLRLLRARRGPRSERAKSGFLQDDLFPAAEALLTLGRRKQAMDLYRELLARRDCFGECNEWCQSRLEQLERASLDDRK
ncbi:MAG: hypothetical protein WBV96_06275 [Polyangia bacterium]